MITQLPAVREAVSSSGVFTRVAASPWLHPNVELANDVLTYGTVPVEKVDFLKTVRSLTPIEYGNVGSFQYQGWAITNFERIFVVPKLEIVTLTFGPYLVIDEKTLQDRHIEMILAHELAHLNNGDSYVKAALYFLGKGWFSEYMTPYGLFPENDRDRRRREQQDVHDITYGVLRGGIRNGGFSITGALVGVALTLGTKMLANTGSTVRDHEAYVTQYFREWDLKADALAEQWVGAPYYYEYLRALPKENAPFEASQITRLQAAETRETGQVLTPAPAAPPVGITFTGIAKTLVFIVLGYVGFFFLVAVLILSASLQ